MLYRTVYILRNLNVPKQIVLYKNFYKIILFPKAHMRILR